MEVLKKVQRNYRRALACLLTIAMTLTNVGTNLSVAFAAKEQAQALFLLDGGELQAAIQDALASEDPFDYASLQLTAGSASLKNSYKKLLGGNGASVYRLDAEIDDSYAPGGTALQMFYNADAESVIFLFINESDTSVVFRANVDGYETARITVSANSANVENEEDLDDSYDESAVYGDGSAAGNTAEDGKIPGEGPGVSTENSTDNGEASDDTEISIEVPVEEADETTEEESVSTSEDSVGEAPPEDMGSDVTDSENDVSVSVDDSPGDSADAAGEADAADQIDEAGTADEEDAVGELDGADEPDDADAIGETLAFSKHEAALVATSVEVIPDEESSDEDEIIISLDEEADMATPSNGQSNEGADADPEDKDIPEVTVEPDDPATATGSNADDGSDIIKVDDEQFLEDDSIAWNGELNGRAYNTVTIWDSANARAFVVDAEELGGSGVFENDQFEGTAQVGDAIITVKAVDADIPETAQVVAEEVVSDQIEASVASKLEEQERTLTEYRAWDIRLVDETGSDLDFDGTVEVTIDGVTLDGDQMDVFHVEEPAAEGVSLFRKAASAPLQAEEIPSDAQDGTVVFETTHFSVYVLIGSIEDAEGYWHVEFKDGETPIANQMIPDGELAMEPAAPDHEGYIFVGWLGSNGETLTDPITQDTVFTAQYQKIETCTITVEFEYADGTMAAPAFTAVVQKKESYTAAVPVPEKQGYEIEIPAADGITYDEGKRVLELSFDSVEEDKDIVVTYQGGTVTYTVKHMLQDLQDEDSYTEYTSETKTAELGTMSAAEAKLIPGFTSVPPTNVNISSDTVIQVLYNRNYYTVSYNTDGGSYIPPVRYKYGARVEMPEAPTKIGYDFAGWDKELNEMPAENTTLTAQWTPKQQASYRVIYWQEKVPEANADPNIIPDMRTGYDYKESYTRVGSVGTPITADPRDYTGFHKSSNVQTGVSVSADGQAVLNVYYDRDVNHIYFHDTEYRWYIDRYVDLGVDDSKTITAKFGQNILDKWNERQRGRELYTELNGNRKYSLIPTMPEMDIHTYDRGKSGGDQSIIYYVEALNGNWLKFSELKNQSFSDLGEEDRMPIDGFTYSREEVEWDWLSGTGDAKLYYTRNSYSISFENAVDIDDAYVKYEASIDSVRPRDAMVRPPETVDSDYTFGGWYTSPACEEGTEVDWNMKMPSHNLQVYAKWVKPKYTVSFNLHGGEGSIDSISVDKYETINLPQDPVKSDGSSFAGWYTDAEYTFPFLKDTQITENLTLHAKWERSGEYSYIVHMKDADSLLEFDRRTFSGPQNENVAVQAPLPDITGPYADYIPTIPSQNLLLDADNKEITFYYTKLQRWDYTVHYVNEQGNPVADSITESTTADQIAVVYKQIDGYTLKGPAPVMNVSKNHPEVTFVYCQAMGSYEVKHWLEDPAEPGTYLDPSEDMIETGSEKVGATVVAYPCIIDGYICETSEIDRAAIIRQNEKVTINVYYKLERYEYTVNYYKKGTTETLAESKTGQAIYNQEITENAIDIANYVVYGADWQTITIQKDPKQNVINFYYIGEISHFVTLNTKDVEKVYDGTPLAAGIATATSKDQGAELKIEYSADGTNWTTEPDEITATEVSDSKTVQVRVSGSNYSDYVEGTQKITITQRPVKITGDGWNVEQPYTGQEYQKTTYQVEKPDVENIRGLVIGQTVENLIYEITGTDVGTYKGEFTGEAKILSGGKDVTANYIITQETGKLKIVASDIAQFVTLNPKDVEKVYDGTPLSAGTATATSKDENTELKIEYSADGTNWTTEPDEITATEVSDSKTIQVRVSGSNYSDYVKGTQKITITQRPVKITGDGWNVEQPYTGQEYQKTTYQVEKPDVENIRGLVIGQTVENLIYEITGTDVGTYKGEFTGEAKILSGGKDVTANYIITQETGKLKIVASDIAQFVTLNPKDVEKVYDGTPLSAGTATATSKDENTELKIEYSADGTNWTTEPDEITATEVSDSKTIQVRVSGSNYSDYVKGTQKITITQRPVKITGDGWNVEQPYTGQEYQKTTYQVEKPDVENIRGLVIGQTVENLIYEITGTDVGTYKGEFTGEAKILSGGKDVTANYIITQETGKLKIVASEIAQFVTLNPKDVEKVYDGTPLAAGIATATSKDEHTELKIEYSADGTNWTTEPDKITATEVSDSKTVQVRVSGSNYEGYLNGEQTIMILQRPLTITAPSASKPFDGTPLKVADGTKPASIEGLAEGQEVDISKLEYQGERVEIGTASNAIMRDSVTVETSGFLSVKVFGGGEDTTENYNIKLVDGILEVTRPNDLSYVVNRIFLDDNGRESGRDVLDQNNGTALYGEKILKEIPASAAAWDGKNYVFLPNWKDYVETKDRVVGLDNAENVVNVYYALDEKGGEDPDHPEQPGGDETPDMYQIIFEYRSKGHGTVEGTVYEVRDIENDGSGTVEKTGISPYADIELKPDANYAFDYWTADDGILDYHPGMDTLKGKLYTEDTTFYVSFAEDRIGEADPDDPEPYDPNKPDNIPDKYQITFTYVSEDVSHGTVAGTIVEVRTRPQNADGSYNMTAKVKPNANVTVTGIGRYNFQNWSDGVATFSSTDAIKQSEGYAADTTFTAEFRYRGGTNGGGGSTPSGPRNPGSDANGGPGAAVVISDPDVPLAMGPQTGAELFPIEDEEVPLAALPKTGRRNANTLIFLISGAMLAALATVSRKKEEE